MQWKQGPYHGWIINQNGSVRVHPNRSMKMTVMATTFTAASSLMRLKLDCYVGYDAAVKGVSIVVSPDACAAPRVCWRCPMSLLGPLLARLL
jgi:hypothetical protein